MRNILIVALSTLFVAPAPVQQTQEVTPPPMFCQTASGDSVLPGTYVPETDTYYFEMGDSPARIAENYGSPIWDDFLIHNLYLVDRVRSSDEFDTWMLVYPCEPLKGLQVLGLVPEDLTSEEVVSEPEAEASAIDSAVALVVAPAIPVEDSGVSWLAVVIFLLGLFGLLCAIGLGYLVKKKDNQIQLEKKAQEKVNADLVQDRETFAEEMRRMGQEVKRAQRAVHRLGDYILEAQRRSPAEKMTDVEVRTLALAPRQRSEEEGEGLAFIEGGTNPDNLNLALRRAVQIESVRLHPTDPTPRMDTIWVREGVLGSITEGKCFVLYADGSQGPVREANPSKPMSHIRAWRVTAVVDGEEVVSYVLTVCANGMGRPMDVDKDVTFVPDETQPSHAVRYTAENLEITAPSSMTIILGDQRFYTVAGQKLVITGPKDFFCRDDGSFEDGDSVVVTIKGEPNEELLSEEDIAEVETTEATLQGAESVPDIIQVRAFRA